MSSFWLHWNQIFSVDLICPMINAKLKKDPPAGNKILLSPLAFGNTERSFSRHSQTVSITILIVDTTWRQYGYGILSGLALNYGHFSCVIPNPHPQSTKRWFSYAGFEWMKERERFCPKALLHIKFTRVFFTRHFRGWTLNKGGLHISFSTYIYSMYQYQRFWLNPCIQSFSLSGNR